MHELFLNTSVSNGDCPRAIQILQGYCDMSPVPVLRRRVMLRGPPGPNQKGLDPAFLLNLKPQQRPDLWKALDEQLKRRPFVITLIYDIKRNHFSSGEGNFERENKPTVECDELPGTLQWTDLPDPGVRPVNSRALISIDGERKLYSMLQSMNYRFVVEFIEEGYRFVYGNVVIYVTRFLTFPQGAQEQDADGKPKPVSTLPPFEVLTPFDGENKWVMQAKVDLVSGGDQELVRKATEELLALKTELEGLFDLKVKDRHIFDTRVK